MELDKMVVVNMRGVGQNVEEGVYPVVLTKATEKPKANSSDILISVQATIKDSGTDFDGRSLFRTFAIKTDAGADNSNTLYYLQQTLLAFGADTDDVTSESLDPVAEFKKLYGNRAEAEVVHTPSQNDPEKVYVNANFKPSYL